MPTKVAKKAAKKLSKKTSKDAEVFKEEVKPTKKVAKKEAKKGIKATSAVIGGVTLDTCVPLIQKTWIQFGIRGTAPMVQNRFGNKAREAMRLKKAGKLTRTREACVPEEEFESAKYVTADGKPGFPAMGLKKAMITAAHRDIGIEKVLVCKAVRLRVDDPLDVLPMEASEPTMREDLVKVGNGAADLRYRPEYRNWTATVKFVIDEGLLNAADVIGLVNRAGFGVGLCEMRPEKKGDFGTFEFDPTSELLGNMKSLKTIQMAYQKAAEEA
jgi:hypothetical protein